jgi:hypothetical protein
MLKQYARLDLFLRRLTKIIDNGHPVSSNSGTAGAVTKTCRKHTKQYASCELSGRGHARSVGQNSSASYLWKEGL